jgi:hypothetical protein
MLASASSAATARLARIRSVIAPAKMIVAGTRYATTGMPAMPRPTQVWPLLIATGDAKKIAS